MSTLIEQPKLRYSENALAPAISAETIGFHYGKHLKAYITNLNNLIVGTEYADSCLEKMAAEANGAIGNNAGQVLNHVLYFEQFAPASECAPVKGELAQAIDQTFGSFEEMKAKMTTAATTLFGSGWAWLCADSNGQLSIMQMPNADNPLRHGLRPLLTFDVWEHAYYIDYRNQRADYLTALWNIIDWKVVEQRYAAKK